SFESFRNTGGRYDPATDTWVATSLVGAPSARDGHKAVWTGTEMIIWGGGAGGGTANTGGRYNPATNTWMVMIPRPPALVSLRAFAQTAVWTGTEMIVWGGSGGGAPPRNTGGRYNPVTGTWTATSSVPLARYSHIAVWTGAEMIVW